MRVIIVFICLCFFLNANNNVKHTENVLIMEAGIDETNGDYLEASKKYLELFEASKDYYFLKRSILMSASGGDSESALNEALRYQKDTKDLDDIEINKVIAQIYTKDKKYNLAVLIMERINDKEKNIYNNFIIANLYYKLGDMDEALKNYIIFMDDEEEYPRERMQALSQIINIASIKDKPQIAIPYMNKYIQNPDNDIFNISFTEIYKLANKTKDLESALKKRLEANESQENVEGIWMFFIDTNKFKEAISLVDKYKTILGDQYKDLLLQTYMRLNDFKKALSLSNELYKDTNISKYLGLSAIYRYELLKNKDKSSLQSIISDLKKSIQDEETLLKKEKKTFGLANAYFYNFLGYLLIDHDIDIQEGLKYASIAVAISPKTFEYIDSLAWGLYKLGECTKANETFGLIPREYIDSLQELKEHKKALQTCKTK